MPMLVKPRGWAMSSLFTGGFRPFFLFGALHAAAMVALWVPWYLGFVALPSAFPPVAWHSHELLFGYVPAIVAGFLLTAVPSWTGRRPSSGLPLIALFTLWLTGRAAIALSSLSSPGVVAALSLAFPLALLAVIGRDIVAARNRRNLKVLAGIGALALAQALVHYEVWRYDRSTYGDRFAVAAIVMLIAIIGGRIVPAFTTNWLRPREPGPLPAPFGRIDAVAAIVGFFALLGWAGAPLLPVADPVLAGLLLVAGVLHLFRQARWYPQRALAEPLVTVLHAGYAFIPLGFLLAGFAHWTGDRAAATAAIHAWTVGGIGLMTLGVMTRATRGHTGRPLTASAGTVAIYLLIVSAALARIVAALSPETTFATLSLAGAAWIAAYLLFALLYGPMLLLPRKGAPR